MSYRFMTLSVLLVAALACGCDKPQPEATSEPSGTVAAPAKTAETPEPAETNGAPAAAATVEVAAAGTKFDPPVKPDQLPEGAWYCDMGTVHFAQMDPGEKCPECGMKLKVRKEQHAAEPAEEPHEHEEGGHDHGDEHGHDHKH